MKILFISSWYPTVENSNFGVFVKEHAKAIQTTDNQLVVLAILCTRSKSLLKITTSEYTDENGIKTIEIILSSRFRDIFHHFIPLQRKIAYSIFKKRIANKYSPDIIHSNVVFPAGMIGDYISGKLNKPHVITEHWSKIAGILQKPYLSQLAVNTYSRAAKILPVSEFLSHRIQQLIPSLQAEKFAVVPNIIDSSTFKYKQKPALSDEIKFCAIATWAKKRNPDKIPELFIESLEQFQKKTNKKITLYMIGGGDRVEELKQLCLEKSVAAEFLGYQTKSQIAEILHVSDFLLHASTIETFGVVLVEALMTGTPVICSNVGALPELVNDKNGVICENNVESWVNGIETAVNKKYNPTEISNDINSKYTYFEVGKKIADIYNLSI